MKKSFIEKLMEDVTIFQDPYPSQGSPVERIVKVIGNLLKKK